MHNREMRYTTKGCVSFVNSIQFSFVQLACKDCAKWTVKLASKSFDFISIK